MDNQSGHTIAKVRRSAEQWRQIITRFEMSNLTQEEFCTRESLALSTFNKWKRRLQAELPAVTLATPEPMFVELASPASPEQQSGWDVELSMGNGMTLRLRHVP